MNLRHLQFVEAIAEKGTVTAAAIRLHVTQPAVSQGLKELEGRLGGEVFRRDGRRMVPTERGRRIVRAAREVAAALARLQDDLDAIEGRTQGTLRVATGCYTCYDWLPSVLAEFVDRFPDVQITVRPEFTAAPFDAILAGELDVAIVQSIPEDPRIRLEKAFEDDLVVVMPPDHSWTALPFVDAEDFQDAVLLIHSDYDGSAFVREVLRPAAVAPKRVHELRLTEAVLGGVRAGVGVSVLASWVVAPDVAAGRLASRPLTAGGLRRQWYSARLDRESSEPLGHFIRLVNQGWSAGGVGRLGGVIVRDPIGS